MVTSSAPTVEAYLAALPPDRRVVVEAVRKRVGACLPKGFVEQMSSGMIGWVVPLSRYPNTYNKLPLPVCALASQKQHVALYLVAAYFTPGDRAAFEAAYAQAGKKLDMGKSCLRFSSLEEVAWEVVEKSLGALDVDGFIDLYERSRAKTVVAKGAPKAAASPKKSAPSKRPTKSR